MNSMFAKAAALAALSLSLLAAGCEKQTPTQREASPPAPESAVSSRAAEQQNKPTQADKMREIAWNSLHKNSQETVEIDWKQAQVAEINRDEAPFPMMDSTLRQDQIPPRLVRVTFPTTQDALLGEIIVYLDPASGEKIGMAPRK